MTRVSPMTLVSRLSGISRPGLPARPRLILVGALGLAALGALGIPMALTTGHDADALVELDPATVAPAGGVVVTGHGLERSVTMRLTLEGTGARVALGDVEVDAAGHFQRLVALPVDLAPGVYGVKVSFNGELVVSSVLVIDPVSSVGQPLDRGPPWGTVLAVVATVIIGFLSLRIVSTRRGRRDRDPAAGPPA